MEEQITEETLQEKAADSSDSSELPDKEASEKEPAGESNEEAFDYTQLLPDKMEEIVAMQVFSLQHWAHIYMGLMPHPKQKKPVCDYAEARIAVDCASALAEALMPHMSADGKREMKVLISDLKMNYISKASGS